jgi:hypothetical protein
VLLLQVGLSSRCLQGISQHRELQQLFQDCRKIWEAQRISRAARLIAHHSGNKCKRFGATAAVMRVPCLSGQDPWAAVAAVGAQQLTKTYKLLAMMVHPDNMTKKITKVVKAADGGSCSPEDLLGREAAKELFDEAMKALGNAYEACSKCAKPK